MSKLLKCTWLLIGVLAYTSLSAQDSVDICKRYKAVYDYVNDCKNLHISSDICDDSTSFPVNIIPEMYTGYCYDFKTNVIDSISLHCIAEYVFRRNEKSKLFVAFSNYSDNKIEATIAYFYALNKGGFEFVIPSLRDMLISDISWHLESTKDISSIIITLEFEFDKNNHIVNVQNITTDIN